MYIPFKNCFRKDLVITPLTQQGDVANRYLIKDPLSGESFEFGEEEYFLCVSMDGNSTTSQIVAAFKDRFNLAISEQDFHQFSAQISEFGLLENCQKASAFLPESPSNSQVLERQTTYVKTKEDDEELVKTNKQSEPEKKKDKQIILAYPNPDRLFRFLARLLAPAKPLFLIWLWLLIPAFILTVLTLANNFTLYEREQQLYVKSTPWLLYHLTNITSVNLLSKLAQGTVCTYYGETVKEFGIQLRLGIVPRGYVSKNQIWKLSRGEQLWCYGTPIIVRISFFVLGIIAWYCTRLNDNGLQAWALSLAYMGLTDFIFDSSPLWPSDGYKWLIAYFRLSPKLILQNRQIWQMMLTFRPLPRHLSFLQKLKLQALAASMIITWGFLAFLIAHHAAFGILESISPGIFGEGAIAVIIAVPFVLALRWWITMQMQTGTSKKHQSKTAAPPPHSPSNLLSNQPESPDWTLENTFRQNKQPISFVSLRKFWRKHLVKILVFLFICIVLSLPYPYRPGGSIQLLPPTQQQIQAQVDGRITKVFFDGGDGKWLKAGTVLANMEVVDIENTVLTTQEQIRQQQAEIEKQQANLKKLLSLPRKEDVAVAQQQVAVAQQQVAVAQQQVTVARGDLQTVVSKAEFSSRQAARYNELYKTGAFSLQQYENAQKEAQTDRSNIEEKKQKVEEAKQTVVTRQQNLQAKKAELNVVLSGSDPQDIEAARQEVAAATANLKRLQQQLKYNQEQIQRTALLMPIDGYLITPYLPQKVGVYLEQGDLFAVAEDNRKVQGQVQVPEYDVGEFSVGREVEIKLLAYPSESITGRVVSIEPVAATESAETQVVTEQNSDEGGRYVKVIVDVPNTKKILKAGMSGYAKIQGSTMPVIVAFTRSIVRFVYLEVWSWLP